MHTKEQILNSSKSAALDMIKSNIAESWQVAAWAIVVVYNNQTATEQLSRETIHHNGVGFSSPDARTISYWAKIIKGEGNQAISSPTIRKLLTNRVSKYAKQILQHIKNDAAKQAN